VRMRRAAVLIAAAAVLAPGCGGGPSARDRVEAYLKKAGAVQNRWTGTFKQANRTYADFAAGRLRGDAATRATARIRDDVRALRDALAVLRPPAEARGLNAKMLHVFDLDLALATETAQLAAYVPAERNALSHLPAANRRLRHRLARAAGDATAQARALSAFQASLDRTVRDLRGLKAPAVLRISRGDRIHALARTAALSGSLRQALRAGDAARTTRLLDRLDQPPPDRTPLARRAAENYNRRSHLVLEAMQDVRRAEAALNRRLAST
jgi:hypothetical protein